jgi:hypothetical protein
MKLGRFLMRRRGRAVVFLTCLICVLAAAAHVSEAEPLGRRTLGGGLGCAGETDACCQTGLDSDGDGLADACEQVLAERFAPIVYHSSDESNFPTNVDTFLAETRLGFHDDRCPDSFLMTHPSQSDLATPRDVACEGNSFRPDGTRSAGKHRTLFLSDVSDADRAGSPDPHEWTIYFHAYPNDIGGVTVQYWRFYAYNDAANDHGGDWEGLHVILDDSLHARGLRLLTHDTLAEPPLRRFRFEGTHVRVFSEGGGHATRSSGADIAARGCGFLARRCVVDPDDPETFVRQETWTGGIVRGPKGLRSTTGRLVNLGAKTTPMNGQVFVRYSGLWGSPGVFFGTSGFWGPAYNETSLRADGFVSAWCEGMSPGSASREECYPRETTR